ncbi:MAG: hypothetical protein HUK07_05530 [Bacteroidaceae bacterium]|nr:hypothetical protein [Bacteroidaceae bacterium]
MEIMRCRHVYVVPGCTIHKLKVEQILAGSPVIGQGMEGEDVTGGGKKAPVAPCQLFSNALVSDFEELED